MQVKKRYITVEGKEIIKTYNYPQDHVRRTKEGCPICQKRQYGPYGAQWGITRKVKIQIKGKMIQIGTYCTRCQSLFIYEQVEQVYRGHLEEFNGNHINGENGK